MSRLVLSSSAFREVAVGVGVLRDSTPCRPKWPPFVIFWDLHFWMTDLQSFLKEPSAPIYTNFEGECAPKKTELFGRIFPKSASFGLCFEKITWGAEKLGQYRVFRVIWESSENQFVDLEKKVEKNVKICCPPPSRNSAPLREISRNAPGFEYLILIHLSNFDLRK